MTNEDAIKWLENLKQDIGKLRHEDLWPYAQAIDEIIALLEEQEAVEPIIMDNIILGTSRKCSKCNRALFPAGKYCPHCGRSVKWND